MAKLGAKYKEKITGFIGTATGTVQYLSGCNQVLLTPKTDDSGKLGEAHWFDEQRLDLLGDDVVTLDNSQANGFDTPAPTR